MTTASSASFSFFVTMHLLTQRTSIEHLLHARLAPELTVWQRKAVVETRVLGQGLQVQCWSSGVGGGTGEGNVTYLQERTHPREAERCQSICQKDRERCAALAEELQSKGRRPAVTWVGLLQVVWHSRSGDKCWVCPLLGPHPPLARQCCRHRGCSLASQTHPHLEVQNKTVSSPCILCCD